METSAVLIPGFGDSCRRAQWQPLRRGLADVGYEIHTPVSGTETTLESAPALTGTVADYIRDAGCESGEVLLVGYSRSGVVARDLAHRVDADRVITVATPHNGTALAEVGERLSDAAETIPGVSRPFDVSDVAYDSSYLVDLNERGPVEGVDYLNVRTEHDDFVSAGDAAPPDDRYAAAWVDVTVNGTPLSDAVDYSADTVADALDGDLRGSVDSATRAVTKAGEPHAMALAYEETLRTVFEFLDVDSEDVNTRLGILESGRLLRDSSIASLL